MLPALPDVDMAALDAAPRRLETMLVEDALPWLKEFKDPGEARSSWATWDGATPAERAAAAKWIRGWAEGDEVAFVKEAMGCLDPMIAASFAADVIPPLRRWAASVLLDVFGSKEDLAECVETADRPKFAAAAPTLAQFSKFEAFDDLWSGDESRAEELLDWLAPAATVAALSLIHI